MLALRCSSPGLLWALCLVAAAHCVMVNSSSPEVLVNSSQIIGQYRQHGSHLVSMYLGIPYATPPVGQLRFQKTVPLKSLPYVIHATSFQPECFSVYPKSQQSEDCLYLNVWVPAEATQPLSVMVWIHGGGFIIGSSNSPEGTVLAAEQQVIVVSLNYRLGAFGFLSTGDSESPGNFGLWDQHTALRWVKDNIASFGGDPQSITIFGESAGGKSVSFQVVSPHSGGGLFQRAILQSGTTLCPTSLQWQPLQTAVRLARALGCPSDSHQTLVHCLRQRNASQIAWASGSLWDEDVIRKLIDFGWAPVEDGDFVPHLYLPDGTPAPLSPTFTGSLMLGNNNNEGALLKTWRLPEASRLDPAIETDLHDPSFFTTRFLPEVMAQMFKTLPRDSGSFQTASVVASFLYEDWNSRLPNISAGGLYSAFGDQAYVAPTFRFLDQWLNVSSNSGSSRDAVYVYIFDNYPGFPAGEGLGGMKHGDDVPYTFGTIRQVLQAHGAPQAMVDREGQLSQDFRTLITNFAKSGNPASPVSLASQWPDWPTYTVQQQQYLAVSSTPRVADHYRDNYMALWNSLVPHLVTRETGSGTSSQHTCPGGGGSSGGGQPIG